MLKKLKGFLMKKILFIFIFTTSSFAYTLSIHDKFPNMLLPDQFGKPHNIPVNTKTVLLTFDKTGRDLIKNFMKDKEESDFFKKNNIVYLMDNSAIPEIFKKFFYNPIMKKYPFKILILNDTFRYLFLSKDDFVTVYKIKNMVIKDLLYIKDTEGLEELFK